MAIYDQKYHSRAIGFLIMVSGQDSLLIRVVYVTYIKVLMIIGEIDLRVPHNIKYRSGTAGAGQGAIKIRQVESGEACGSS
eukprot:scaffold7649_cov154-Skeletonema_marinoi.AAC.20